MPAGNTPPATFDTIEREFMLSDGSLIKAVFDQNTALLAKAYRDDLLISRDLTDDTTIDNGLDESVMTIAQILAHGSKDQRFVEKCIGQAISRVKKARAEYRASAQAEALMVAVLDDSLFLHYKEGKVTRFKAIKPLQLPDNMWDDSKTNDLRNRVNLPPLPVRNPASIVEQKLVYLNALLADEPLFNNQFTNIFRDTFINLAAKQLGAGVELGEEDGETDEAGFHPSELAGHQAGETNAHSVSSSRASANRHRASDDADPRSAATGQRQATKTIDLPAKKVRRSDGAAQGAGRKRR